MVIISKHFFYEKIGPEVKCKDLMHQWTDSCLEANLKFSLECIKGIFYFYLPIYLIKVLIDYKKIDKKYLKNIVKAYIRSQSYSTTFAALFIMSICTPRNILGRFYYYNVGFLPGVVSGLSIFLEHPENRHFNMLIWTSMVIEALFNNAYYFKIIRFSKIRETLMFMAASSLLMHLLANTHKEKIPSNIWFYRSHIKHGLSNPSFNNCFNEFLKYFGIGYALNGARHLISVAGIFLKNPLGVMFNSLFNEKNFKFGMVFGAYAGLFRTILWLLGKYNGRNNFNAAIAGFVAGIAYYIKPTINLLAIAITTILQILCRRFLTIPKSCEKVPFTEILYMLNNGILGHNRIIALDTCPKYYSNMLQVASSGLINRIYSTVVQHYLLI